MDVFDEYTNGNCLRQIKTVGMHTAGEPTRIIVQGFPELHGPTLLEKRNDARTTHDGIRKRLMFEPRGHYDMYGAILIPETELVKAGKADIGVLFCHNEGFSTMCGHATLALGRFLVDTKDTVVFPKRQLLQRDGSGTRVDLTIHAPCGPVQVSVPVLPGNDSQVKSDASKPVHFLSVPSYTTAVNLTITIPDKYLWPEIQHATSRQVTIDIAYGGAFYAIVSPIALGFSKDKSLATGDTHSLPALKEATRLLKAYLTETPEFRQYYRHPTEPDLEYLYGIIVVEISNAAKTDAKTNGASTGMQEEVGICFFADQQIDRSPCGSGVSARVALWMAKASNTSGLLGVPRTYHSLVTKGKGTDAFVGSAYEKVIVVHDERHLERGKEWEAWVIKVEGKGYYTDTATFVLEEDDNISKEGFVL
ncbi:hypothetical protein M422DRAFT_230633 [Sphaerobolus stellatus SS14]|uniref:trans-L-3-hydroxyproline dehydratase n=1 Tax=Sphaerobolus stellatus (strain SS14) TaxID=990650 RepID=A0A0C9VNV6_SPHS4|nr:hypothetical protein M422DRAFT_230633 [Sphaerobolus stellatus SS14]